jgi:hypothetical protein
MVLPVAPRLDSEVDFGVFDLKCGILELDFSFLGYNSLQVDNCVTTFLAR